MGNLKNVVYLSRQDYKTLINNGQVTVKGVTVQYSDDDIHVTRLDSNTYSEEEKEAARKLIGVSELYRHSIDVSVNAYGYIIFNHISNSNAKIVSNQELYDLLITGILGFFSGPINRGIVTASSNIDQLDVIYMSNTQTETLTITGITDTVTKL
jgi:hypothetical protein